MERVVLQDYRGRGIYAEMNKWRMQYLRQQGITKEELKANKNSRHLHIKNGGIPVKEYKSATKIVYENIQINHSI